MRAQLPCFVRAQRAAPVRLATFLLAALGAVGAAAAQSGPPPHGPHKPPPEAFTACEGKSKAADCTVDFHGKQLEGICVLEEQSALFCMPNDMPPHGGGHGGPPPEQ